MKKSLLFLSSFLIIVFTWTSCRKIDVTNDPQTGSAYFVSATPIGNFTKTELQTIATKSGFSNFASLVKYDVDFYKVIYRTSYKGNLIQVSGLLAIPKNMPYVPSLLSAQHGTIFSDSDTPSNFPNTFSGFELFASVGFVTLIPDFIGYGVSQNITHPYYDKQYSALTVVNMIEAVKYYLHQQKKAITNKLFLVGYSEGGYTTMAAQEEIETNPSHQLKVTAAAEGAGGYDLPAFMSVIANSTSYAAPSFLALFLKAYNDTYDWNLPMSTFFQQPYASQIPALLNGTKSGGQIDAALTNSLPALFNPAFYAGLKNPAGQQILKAQLADNSFLSWVPKSPTQLYHGTSDEDVPFETSVSTYNRFKAGGAANVQFFPVPGGTHETSVTSMMLSVLLWIKALDL